MGPDMGVRVLHMKSGVNGRDDEGIAANAPPVQCSCIFRGDL